MKLTYLGGLLFSATLCTGAFADVVVSEEPTLTEPAPIVTERTITEPAPIVTERTTTTTAPAIESQTTTTTTVEHQKKLSHREKERMEKEFKRELRDR